jgi:hypothetical protein
MDAGFGFTTAQVITQSMAIRAQAVPPGAHLHRFCNIILLDIMMPMVM